MYSYTPIYLFIELIKVYSCNIIDSCNISIT